jgi:DNA modification methylase
MNYTLYNEDCLIQLKELEDNSIDSIITDPPYEISFMSKGWDGTGIAFNTEVWTECLRVLKPGGHLLAFGGTRTYHRMTVAIEDSGFEIRDCIFWCYGSGFPKSHNIGKAVDKLQGNEREVVGKKNHKPGWHKEHTQNDDNWKGSEDKGVSLTKGNSEWEGWGTALKPALEPITVARKPLSEKTVAENCLKWGTGGINIDESRIPFKDEADRKESTQKNQHADFGTKPLTGNVIYGDYSMVEPKNYNPPGRFPANIIFDEEAGKILDEQSGTSKFTGGTNDIVVESKFGQVSNRPQKPFNFGDTGGASRFFYCPKVSKSERNEGLDIRNPHPTMKPLALMLYLIRLITPKGGTTLDPFMGSGSTGKAAVRGGFNFIGIEREEEYYEIAQARIDYEQKNPYIEEKGERIEVNENSQKFW